MTYVIGVCGASCSGKTTICNEISNKIRSTVGDHGVVIVSQDSYYHGGNANTNYDMPDAIDFKLMVQQVKQLIKKEPIECPIYDFSTFSRQQGTKTIMPADIVIIEGILIFYHEELRNLCNLKVFVSAYPELRYARRLKRDLEERGQTNDEIERRYFRDVLPASRHYVDPTIELSDIALMNNTLNKFVGLEILLDHIKKKIDL